jgi:hypothetical protein
VVILGLRNASEMRSGTLLLVKGYTSVHCCILVCIHDGLAMNRIFEVLGENKKIYRFIIPRAQKYTFLKNVAY